MDLKKTFINFALLGLVIFSFMSFIIIFQGDNNVDEKLINNEIINRTYNDLYGNLSNAQTQAETQNNRFGSQTPTESFGVIQIDTVASPTQAFKSITIGIYNILIKLPMSIFGVSQVVASIISAILIILLIVGIWAVWKGAIQ